jgi:hypothetical protein
MQTYAIAHYMQARLLLAHAVEDAARSPKSAAALEAAAAESKSKATDTADHRVEVTRLLRTAAGIFSYLAKVFIVRSPAQLIAALLTWHTPPRHHLPVTRPLVPPSFPLC